MFIEIHGLNMVIHGMGKQDIITLCDCYLGLKFDAFTTIKEHEGGKYLEKRYKFPNEDAKESVYIQFKDRKPDSMTIVNLKGSFFDNSPDFRLSKLLAWLAKYQWTPKQLDVAYVDDDNYLSIDKIICWCEDRKKYCAGSLFGNRPKILREEKDFDAIRLAKATSTTNYGTIYVRDTGHVRIEIKIKNIDKILYLLDSYDDKKPRKFNDRSLKLLVSCIDFITSKTKKTRDPDQYVRQHSWRQFLGSDTKKITFKQIVERRRSTRGTSNRITFDKKIRRTATMVKNMVERLSVEHALEDIFKIFAEKSGYRLKKTKTYIDLDVKDDM
ncbi:hypothetical protein [Geobacter sp. AOG2]|uniref:hypothetical protein n=1 Tax=Geobacter sp. AOG2 TaxID=1566347 RepID=UPI001CC4AA86|nr:hypothetical protein [Geobacter sp. AOG2]GFE60780.1 hypothetical protein AOG2_13680 [Geobacter sp. AOG2]